MDAFSGAQDSQSTKTAAQLGEDADFLIKNVRNSSANVFSDDLGEDDAEKSPLKHFVSSPEFQYSILFFVLLGAIIAGMQTDRSLRHSTALHVVDALILLVFTVEAALRLAAEWPEPQRYFSDSWNTFDFTIVVCGILDLIITAAGVDMGGGAACLVVLRLFRLLRLLKMMRAIPQLQLLATTMLNSLPAMLWMCVPLFLIFYMFGCIGCFAFQVHDPRHFGNLGRAFVTLFRITTLDTWNYIMYIEMYGCANYYREVDKQVYGCDEDYRGSGRVASLYFFVFILLSSFCLINLFIGVVMGELTDSSEECETLNAQLAEMEGKPNDLSSPEMAHATVKQIIKSVNRKVDVNRRRATLLKESITGA